MHAKSSLCERARAWASLRIDGELSELESALLDAHLGRCDSCRTFAQGAQEVAAMVRGAALERPAPRTADQLGTRRRGLRALQVAAAVVVVVSAGVGAAVSGTSSSASAAKPVSMVANVDSPDRMRELRRPGLVRQIHAVLPRNRLVPGEPV